MVNVFFKEFERGRAFLFLHEIKKRFETMYGSRAQTAIAYAMNGDFGSVLRGQISQFGEGKDVDSIARVHGQLEELKDIMVKNIGWFVARLRIFYFIYFCR